MDQPILLILTGDDYSNAAKAALDYAAATCRKMRVLQILTSDLYHYGHQDLVATRPSKRQFLLYIREEVLERGKREIQSLEETARASQIPLEIIPVESEDIFSASISEAKKGYDMVFLPKQERKLFPLFKTTLAEHLRRRLPVKIVSC